MSAHVLLNLLNLLRKRDKMLGKPRILSFFCNKLNKFNNTRTRMFIGPWALSSGTLGCYLKSG